MGYIAKYKIDPGPRGWVLSVDTVVASDPYDGDEHQWIELGKYDNEDKAIEAMMRVAKPKPKFYDENGEAV